MWTIRRSQNEEYSRRSRISLSRLFWGMCIFAILFGLALPLEQAHLRQRILVKMRMRYGRAGDFDPGKIRWSGFDMGFGRDEPLGVIAAGQYDDSHYTFRCTSFTAVRVTPLATVAEMKAYLDERGIRYSDLFREQDGRMILDMLGTPTESVEVLSDLELNHIRLRGSKALTDISPLRRLPLTGLNLTETGVVDLSALKGLSLDQLHIGETGVSDLTPLRGMKLEYLNARDTHITDLSPLKGMPLRTLDVRGTQVSDLAPLAGMPLMSLFVNDTRVRDLSVVATMPKIWEVFFSPENIKEGIQELRQAATIRCLGANRYASHFLGIEEFWPQYDADPEMARQRKPPAKER